MKNTSICNDALWPILTTDERLPLPPAVWVALNFATALLIAVPFFVVIGVAAFGFWGANSLRDVAVLHGELSPMTVTIAANFVKILLALLSIRVEWLLLDLVPWAVREARAVFAEVVSEAV